MQHLLEDKCVVTFDISDIFNESKTEMEQIDPDELPDGVLKEILINEEVLIAQNTDENDSQLTTRSECEENNSEGAQPNRFRNISKGDADQIASNSCKKKKLTNRLPGV